ncbi:MAG: hypothetical protein Q9226_009053 [Calogaya cf. arnoldii]
MYTLGKILTIAYVLSVVVVAVPNLGIKKDFLLPSEDDHVNRQIQSYSGVIKFDDPSIPLDKEKMSDRDLLHLAVLAYGEMHAIWGARQLPFWVMPGAMAAVAYQDKIFFASSIKAPSQAIKLKDVHDGSVSANMEDALTMGLGTHRYGGACAEINIIQLIEESNKDKEPERGPPAPRVAIWVRPSGLPVGTEFNAPPCTWESGANPGYGCHDVIKVYGIEAIGRVAPDASKENEWRFRLHPSWRLPCP